MAGARMVQLSEQAAKAITHGQRVLLHLLGESSDYIKKKRNNEKDQVLYLIAFYLKMIKNENKNGRLVPKERVYYYIKRASAQSIG